MSGQHSGWGGRRKGNAANLPTHGENVALADLHLAIEIRNAVQYATLQDLDDGISGMKVCSEWVPDLQNRGVVNSVIVRPEDVSFWNQCIELGSNRHKVCGVGNPGIGKTTTTTCSTPGMKTSLSLT